MRASFKDNLLVSLSILFLLFLMLEGLIKMLSPLLSSLGYLFFMLFFYLYYFKISAQRFFRFKLLQTEELLLLLLLLIMLISSLLNDVALSKGFQVFFYSLKFLPILLLYKMIHVRSGKKTEVYIIVILLFEVLIGLLQFMIPSLNQWFLINLTPYNMAQYQMNSLVEKGVSGTFASKNIYATLMNIAFALSFLHWMEKKSRFYLVATILFALSVFISGSKMNELMLLSFLLIYFKKSSLSGLMLLLAILLGVSILLLFNYNLNSEFLTIFSDGYIKNTQEFGRLLLLIVSFDVISDNPIWGVGAGNWGTGLAYTSLAEGVKFATYNGVTIFSGILQDNYWLSLISQFGFIYVFIFSFLLFHIYKVTDRGLITKYIFIIMLGSSMVYPSYDMKVIAYIFFVYFALHYKNRVG